MDIIPKGGTEGNGYLFLWKMTKWRRKITGLWLPMFTYVWLPRITYVVQWKTVRPDGVNFQLFIVIKLLYCFQTRQPSAECVKHDITQLILVIIRINCMIVAWYSLQESWSIVNSDYLLQGYTECFVRWSCITESSRLEYQRKDSFFCEYITYKCQSYTLHMIQIQNNYCILFLV